MSLGKKVFTSAFLLFVRKIWGNVINLVVMAFLARMLSKEDFGLLAISSVLLSIINTLATSGIAEYVVFYKGEDERQHVSAAFWLNLLLTFGVVVIVVLVGPAWSSFYGSETITPLLFVLLVSFFFEMLSTIPKALLRKDLNYQVLVYYSSVSMTVVSMGKLAAAWWGLGVYSLAVPQAIVSPLLCASFFLKTGWRPMTQLGTKYFGVIVTYTRSVIGGRVLTRLVNEGDNLIIGKFVGLEGLGIYALAFQLANLITTNVVFMVNDLFLPLFSKVRMEHERLREIYVRSIQFLCFLSFPLMTGLIVAAPAIVEIVYGPTWAAAVLPFRILCLFALGRSLSSPSSGLFSAVGRPDLAFRFAAFFVPLFLVCVALGSQYGVVGVAVATTITRVVGSLTLLYLSLRLIGLSLSSLYAVVRSNLLVTAVVAAGFLLVLPPTMNPWMLAGVAAVVVYVHLLVQRFLFRSSFSFFHEQIAKYLPSEWMNDLLNRLFFLQAGKQS